MPMLFLVLSLTTQVHPTPSHSCSSFLHSLATSRGSCYELRLDDFPRCPKRNDLVGNFWGKFPSVDLTSPVPQTQHVRLLYFSPDRICTSSVSCQCYWLEPKLKRLKATLITQTSSHCTPTHLWKPSLSYTPEAWLSPTRKGGKVTPSTAYTWPPSPSSGPTVVETLQLQFWINSFFNLLIVLPGSIIFFLQLTWFGFWDRVLLNNTSLLWICWPSICDSPASSSWASSTSSQSWCPGKV